MPHARPIAVARPARRRSAAAPGVPAPCVPAPCVPAPGATAILLLALLALSGCARDGRDWSAAQDADTQEAYEAFLTKHPQSEFASRATERAAQLVEERDWAVATQSDTPDAYRKFIDQHVDGKWTQEARIRVENFNVMAAAAPEVAPVASAPTAATAARATAAPAAAAQSTPGAAPKADPKPAAVRPVAAPTPAQGVATNDASTGSAVAATAHRIQLGAFSSTDKAEGEWQRVRARFAALAALEPRITAVQTAAGRLFRLQADVTDAAGAKSLCATLQAGGQACLYVPPQSASPQSASPQ